DAVSVSFRKVTWSAGRKYLITFSYQVPEVVLEMERTGWIHFVHGFHHGSRDKRNRTARIWMSEKLAHLFFKIVPAEDICQEFKQPVILRNSDKKDIPYLDTPFSNRRRKDIQKYNAFMKPFKVEYTPCERATVKNLYFEEFNVFREYTPNWMYHFFKYRVKRRSDTEGYVLKEEDRKTIPNTKNRQDNRENTGLLEQIVVKVLLNTDLTCVFNRGETMEGKAFRLGGRFYTGDRGHQGISRAERATITINGEPTVELDFKAYHISMLYAMNGWQIEGDPYIIEGKENLRTLVKKLLLVGLNADSERATLGRIGEDIFSLLARQEITEEELDLLSNIITSRPDWKKLIQDLKRKHETIAGHFFNDAGIHLMNRDSRIMRDILMDLIGKGVPCLPVHDSVIVPERYKDELRMVMDKCYRKHMNGLTCPIEQK
ncbi:MAG: hypothetical protein NT118_02405, partial [Lentisphaerae bacterium]|nr:hypothetical protein [Lentisphaerota bacterium]